MSHPDPLAYDAPLPAYEARAQSLFAALIAADQDAAWMFKWEHPRYRGKQVTDVKPSEMTLHDAQLVVAHRYAFDSWKDLVAYTEDVQRSGPVARFEQAVESVVNGNANALSEALQKDPSLVRARSTRRHHATLLHYVAANGVEGARQKTPANAVEIAKLLLDAGAEADALADMYGGKCATMAMLVSSAHPAQANLQVPLAELLLDHGANPEGTGSQKQSPLLIALAFGYSDTAQALARRASPKEELVVMAGLGRTDVVSRLLPKAEAPAKQKALALAAQHGHTGVVQVLLDAGVDPNRYNPNGFHAHSTPLHQAVWSNHESVVRLLVERGARLDMRDTVYDGTPLDWAIYGKHEALADYLRRTPA